MKDSLESKLFGIGSESFVVGSHEFYLGYALTKGKLVCLDLGHFHPTESVADKISAILQFSPEILLHVSRGVRWDSDHVVLLNDEIRALAEEIVRGQALDRTHIALDYFDASLNRIGAWVLGARATLRGLLIALLEPRNRLQALDGEGRVLARLAALEELKAMPFGPVWDYFCLKNGVPPADLWLREVEAYEKKVLSRR
jgi:L-rhamnose isomerase